MYIEVCSEYKMYLEVHGASCTGPTQKRALGQGFLCECRRISTPGARVVWDFVGFVLMIGPIRAFLVGFEPTTCCIYSAFHRYLTAVLLRIQFNLLARARTDTLDRCSTLVLRSPIGFQIRYSTGMHTLSHTDDVRKGVASNPDEINLY
jgi:hypothetical protein